MVNKISSQKSQRPTISGYYWWRMKDMVDENKWTKPKVVWVGNYVGCNGLAQIISGEICPVNSMTVSEWIGPLKEPDWE